MSAPLREYFVAYVIEPGEAGPTWMTARGWSVWRAEAVQLPDAYAASRAYQGRRAQGKLHVIHVRVYPRGTIAKLEARIRALIAEASR